MFESIYAESFIASVLKGDATLIGATALNGSFIYPNRAPQGTTTSPTLYPLVIYNLMAGGDVNTLNGLRMFTRPLFQVRTVGKVSGTLLENSTRVITAANRVDDLLASDVTPIRRRSYTVGAVTFFYNVWREEELPIREEPGPTADVFYRIYSGLYRVEVLP